MRGSGEYRTIRENEATVMVMETAMSESRVRVVTADDCRQDIVNALASIHESVDEVELRRRVESREACHHELAAWEQVRSARWLMDGEL